MEVLREPREHCLNYSTAQLPSAPRSKAEDYQQPAVMRPRWLEITATARYTLPPTTALLQETAVEHPEKDNSNLVMWVSLHVNFVCSLHRVRRRRRAGDTSRLSGVRSVRVNQTLLVLWFRPWCSVFVSRVQVWCQVSLFTLKGTKQTKTGKQGRQVFMQTHYTSSKSIKASHSSQSKHTEHDCINISNVFIKDDIRLSCFCSKCQHHYLITA